ncbi:MAG: hypothetical protein ONB46_26100 [candidate division KSB1 bacterium]|nr:hypothetical protein [candidate division KSB1 bacterium]MDZ7366870.1 hypothetical protein [candidate division KSB1 bacterium]MDZ7407490.1 hypothetical protein [candidate division KSB1 bacterium]
MSNATKRALAGSEKAEFDPRRWVFAGGKLFVERVKFGLANFA